MGRENQEGSDRLTMVDCLIMINYLVSNSGCSSWTTLFVGGMGCMLKGHTPLMETKADVASQGVAAPT